MISIFVPGLPVAQPRAKAVAFGGRARVYNPGTANEWKACVIHAFKSEAGAFKEGVPVRLVMHFHLPRPNGHFGSGKNSEKLKPSAPSHHTKKPDADNLAKAVMDALTAAGVWVDDSQVAVSMTVKLYADGPTGCRIMLEEMK